MSTNIDWVQGGDTWNPITGCTPVSAGCNNCYARRMSQRLAGRYGYPKDGPFRMTLHPDRVRLGDTFNRLSKSKWIFVCSMGDLFHDDVPDEFIGEVFHRIEWEGIPHTFLFLTKRPERMRDLMLSWRSRIPPFQTSFPGIRDLPKKWWFGVSVEDQQTANERIPILCQIPSASRFVSAEPLLGPIDLGQTVPCGYYCDERVGHVDHPFWSEVNSPIHWVIVGGETGPRARPCKPEWIQSLWEQCQVSGVPMWLKQLGGYPDSRRGEKAILLNGQTCRQSPEEA